MFVFPSELHQAVIVQRQPGCFVKQGFVRRTRGTFVSTRLRMRQERGRTPGALPGPQYLCLLLFLQ